MHWSPLSVDGRNGGKGAAKHSFSLGLTLRDRRDTKPDECSWAHGQGRDLPRSCLLQEK